MSASRTAVRTRFAPSPTGYLHIGGVRTALYNWLFARRHGGSFVLRIDDTDEQRNVSETLAPILDGFRWLGIDWDEGPEIGGPHAPYFQSQRRERHAAAASRLLESGLAYWDYARPEELAAERDAARAGGGAFLYSRRFMARTPAERAAFEADGRTGVVRLLMPREGSCRFSDLIRGDMQFDWSREQDHAIQRADGSCLYHLASVVDDHEMRISHVIRAEEHLPNTPRQIFIATGLGYDLPQYAHLPYVAEPGSKNKLSKRKLGRYLGQPDFAALYEHGRSIAARLGLAVADETFNPVLVEFYERTGWLPQALVNYLLLLGWALDDRTEDFTRDEMIEQFSLERVNRAPASFDPKKLLAFEERRMLALAPEERAALALPFLVRAGLVPEPAPAEARHTLKRVVEAAADRIKVAGDILDHAAFFVADERMTWDEEAFAARVRTPPEARGLLAALRVEIARIEPFAEPALEQLLRTFAAEHGTKLGPIVNALRVAVTGRAVGFGLYETLTILGRARVLRRIDLALERVA
jgi:glutamyl-tRNA synthetase